MGKYRFYWRQILTDMKSILISWLQLQKACKIEMQTVRNCK